MTRDPDHREQNSWMALKRCVGKEKDYRDLRRWTDELMNWWTDATAKFIEKVNGRAVKNASIIIIIIIYYYY